MPFSLSDYIAQTVARFGGELSPEIIQALQSSYESGAASQIIAGNGRRLCGGGSMVLRVSHVLAVVS
jgi:hypothetical protein